MDKEKRCTKTNGYVIQIHLVMARSWWTHDHYTHMCYNNLQSWLCGFAHLATRALVRRSKRSGLPSGFQFIPSVSRLWSELCPGPLILFTSALAKHVFTQLILCTGVLPRWSRLEPLTSNEGNLWCYTIQRHCIQLLTLWQEFREGPRMNVMLRLPQTFGHMCTLHHT